MKDETLPEVYVTANQLILSPETIKLLEVSVGDRIAINYYQIDDFKTIPLISKAEIFADKLSGNKVTKNNTISFRGDKNKILSEYGTKFYLKQFKANIFQLISF